MTTYRLSVKGTLLERGQETREALIAALPGRPIELSQRTGFSRSLVSHTMRKLQSLGVVKRVVYDLDKTSILRWELVDARIPAPPPTRILKTFTDPQKLLKADLSPSMRQRAAEAPACKNVWNRPVWTPPAWTPPRGPSRHIPSRGK